MATAATATGGPLGRAGVKGLCIATRCTDVDDFIARFSANCDETSLFVATTATREIGQASPFVILLADKTPVMRGKCVVLEAWTDADNPFGRPGIQIALEQLDEQSEQVFERLVAAHGDTEAELAPEPPPAQPVRNATMIGLPVLRAPAPRGGEPAITEPQPDVQTERMATPPAGVIELGLGRPLPPLPARPVVIDAMASGEVRRTKGMRIATPCKTMDEFVDAFHACAERSSFFIATRSMRTVGTESAFSIDLADGRPVLRGYCSVLEAWPTSDNRFKRPGVLIRLAQLTADSRKLFDRLLAVAKPEPPAIEATPPDRLTRPLAALGQALGERFSVPAIKPMVKPRGDATLPRMDPRPPAPIGVAVVKPVAAAPRAASVDDEWSVPTVASDPPFVPEPVATPVAIAPVAVVAPAPASAPVAISVVPDASAPVEIAQADPSITPIVDPASITALLGGNSITPVVDPTSLTELLAVGTRPRVDPAPMAPTADTASGILVLGGGSIASVVGASPIVPVTVEPEPRGRVARSERAVIADVVAQPAVAEPDPEPPMRPFVFERRSAVRDAARLATAERRPSEPLKPRRRRLALAAMLIVGVAAGGGGSYAMLAAQDADAPAPTTTLIAVPVPMPVLVPAPPAPTSVPQRTEIETPAPPVAPAPVAPVEVSPPAHVVVPPPRIAPAHPAAVRPKAAPIRRAPAPVKRPATCADVDCL